MSTCPSKDLHSVYLDNELPEIYKKEYEAHVEKCPKCQKELAIIKALHSSLSSESKEITPDAHYLDESWERLQIKMKYKNNVITASKKSPEINYKPFVFVAAAAAALFAIVVPVKINSPKIEGIQGESTLAMNTATPMATVMAQTISDAIESVSATTANMNAKSKDSLSLDSGKTVIISGNIEESALAWERNGKASNGAVAQNVSSKSKSDAMGNVEIFRPNFDEDKAIYIKVTLPSMESVYLQPINGK